MSPSHAVAPEFVKQPSFTLPSNRLMLRGLGLLLRLQRRGFAFGDRVDVRSHSVRCSGGHEIPVFEIAPKDLSGTAPALVDYHGGGFFLTYAASHLSAAERYAVEGRCRVFFPDYRLSVAHPARSRFRTGSRTSPPNPTDELEVSDSSRARSRLLRSLRPARWLAPIDVDPTDGSRGLVVHELR